MVKDAFSGNESGAYIESASSASSSSENESENELFASPKSNQSSSSSPDMVTKRALYKAARNRPNTILANATLYVV